MPDAYTNLRFADSKPEWMHYDGGSRPAKLYGTVPEGAGGSYSLEFNIHGRKPFYSLPVTVLGENDNTPPDAPSITGSEQTTGANPTVTGVAEAGSIVVIYKGNTSLGTENADSEGKFSFTLSSMLSDGSYGITAKAKDSAGNISQSSGLFNLVVASGDSTAPIMTISAEKADGTPISSGSTTTHSELYLTFTVSEAVSNFTADDVSSFDGNISNFSATSSTLYRATFNPDGFTSENDIGEVLVPPGSYSDAAGNIGGPAVYNFKYKPENTAQAVITISGTSQTYDGIEKKVTVTTNPALLNAVVIYTDSDGSVVASPTEIGDYVVVVTVDDDNYEGSASGTLSIIAATGAEGSTDSGGTTTTTENFGDPVTYTNVATTLIGQVMINGAAAREGDVVAVYVGDELRGKQAVVVYAGTAWVNAQVHASGGVETAAIKVYEASTGITHDKVGLSVEIKPEGEAGAFAEPLLIQMDNVAPELTLLGEVQVTIDQRTTYADAGASATDNVDGDLTSKIVVTGAVDTSTAGTYTLKYDVSDAAGNAAERVSRTVVVEKTTVIQTVNLKAGWNLISFYVESEDMAPATVLASIKGNLAQIKDLKSSYNPSLPPFLNTLKGLNLKDGYWVSVDADVSFDLEGEVPAGASITVKPGWNLVGYPRENGAAPGTELTSLGSIVEQFKNLKSSYDPALPPFLNTLKVIAPGLGYWLKVSADGDVERGGCVWREWQ